MNITDNVKPVARNENEQQRDVLYDAAAGAFEDIAMAHAIQDGDQGDYVSRDEVFSILENPA